MPLCVENMQTHYWLGQVPRTWQIRLALIGSFNLLTIPKTRFPILTTFSLLASIADPPIQIRCGLRGCPQPSWHSDSGDKFSSVSDTVIIS